MLIDEAIIEAVRLEHQSISLLRLEDQGNVVALALIFTSLAIDAVIHEFVKILLHILVRLHPAPTSHDDVRVHPGRMKVLDHAIHLGQPRAVIEVGFEV